MPYYRLYHLDQNRFVGVDNFHAGDDGQAIRQARQLNGTTTCELWEGGRRITTLQAKENAGSQFGAAPASASTEC